MGRAARWLLALLRGKKSAEAGSPSEKRSEKEKKRWGFVKSFREREKGQNRQKQCPIQPLLFEQKAGSYRDGRMPLMSESDEQGRRAVAVVGLTTSSRSVGFVTGEKYECAAIKIQASFRGYLARRALRALKGLVKLQALARGNIVRKQAVETLRCMKALVRVQTRARDGRALLSETSRSTKSSRSNPGPPTPEKYESATRSDASKTTNLSGSLKRNSSKKTRLDNAHKERSTEHWNWLDQWMEERYLDSGEVSKPENDEKNAKFLEMNTGKPANRNSNRRTNKISSYSSILYSDQNSRCLSGMPDSPSKDSTTAQLSIPSPSSSVHNIRQSRSPLRFPIIEHEDQGGSPKFFSAASRSGSSRRGSFTPAKSDYSRSLLSDYSDNPNYMANTESSRAKARSVSAPKQRPTEFEKSNTISRLSGQGLIAQRSSLHSKFLNKAYPGSGRLDRLGLPIRM